MTPDATPQFGDLLRSYRRAAGLTQEALAELAGLSARAISDLERGLSLTPRVDTLERLAQSLKLSGQERSMFRASAGSLGLASDAAGRVAAPPRAGAAQPSLVGRAHELDLLDAHIAGDGPPVMLFAGEPGIGKSRLLREAGVRAELAGFHVVRGGCQRRGGQDPFAPVVGALQAHVRSRLPLRLREDLRGCAWLVRLLPELADGPIEPLPSRALPAPQERRLTFEAAGRFLANIGGHAGTMLILDDLQWAGVDALDLLVSLVGTSEALRLRIVGAYRDTEVWPGDPLGVALADLAHAGAARQCSLPPLDPASAEVLLDELLPSSEGDVHASRRATRERVLRRAGGVPFYLVSFAYGLRVGATVGDAAADALPWDVRQGLHQRVASLFESAQEVLAVASIAGRVVSRALLAKASGLREGEIVAALDVACAARLIEPAGEGTYQFAHDVIREVVEANLGPARRAFLHRIVAESIEHVYADRLPEQYEALALHCVRGEVWEKAFDYLVKAGDKAADAYAHQRALDAYARALDLCTKLGAPAQATAVAVAHKRGFIAYSLGRLKDAIVDFDRMGAVSRQIGDRHGEGMALTLRGMCMVWDRDFAAAERELVAALRIADEGHDDVRFAAGVWLGGMLTSTGREQEGVALLAPIEDLGTQVGDSFSRFWWSSFMGAVLGWQGRYDQAIDTFARHRRASSSNVVTHVASLWMEALVRGGKGDYQVAFDLLRQVLDASEGAGEPWWRARAHNLMGWLYGELYDPNIALDWNRRGIEAAQALPAPDLEIENNARLNAADNLMALGRLDEAIEQLRIVEPVVLLRRPADLISLYRYSQHFYHSSGEYRLVRGEYAEALRHADACLAIAEPKGHRKNVVKGHRLRGQVFLAQGSLDDAGRELDIALEVARELGNPPQLWKTLVVVGDVRAARGESIHARWAYHDALVVIELAGTGLSDAALRETFLRSEPVQAIRRLAP